MTGNTEEKKTRGRPRLVSPENVVSSADAYAGWLRQYWPKLGPRILAARFAEKPAGEIALGIQEEAPDIETSLNPLHSLMAGVIRDRRFPRVRTEAQIQFLADSMGGQGHVTPRRSREICAKERSKVKHFIQRREYYIECTCGYQGPALDGACRDCGTRALSQDLLITQEGQS